MVPTISKGKFQPSRWRTPWSIKKSERRGVEANFGWESLPNSIETYKWAWRDTAS